MGGLNGNSTEAVEMRRFAPHSFAQKSITPCDLGLFGNTHSASGKGGKYHSECEEVSFVHEMNL